MLISRTRQPPLYKLPPPMTLRPFLSTASSPIAFSAPLLAKRGRGTTKSVVAIAVEIRQPKGFGRVRMRHVPDATGDSLLPFVRDVVAPLERWCSPMNGAATTDCLNMEHYNDVETCMTKLEASVISLAKPFRKEVELVATTPSIKDFSAIAIISEIGVDM